MSEENCDYVGMVDFGNGPVQVRCTEVGPHEQHRCEVILGSDPVEYQKHNVFDTEEDGG